MRQSWTTALAITSAVTFLVVVLAYETRLNDACRDSGGVRLRTMWGYECVKAEVIRP